MAALMRLGKVAQLNEDKGVERLKPSPEEIDGGQKAQHRGTEDDDISMTEIDEVAEQHQEAAPNVEGDSAPFQWAHSASMELARIWF